MSTSNTTVNTTNRNKIIRGALRLLGQLAEGEDPTGQQMIDAAESLNSMINTWKARGLNLWKYAEGTIFLKTGQEYYRMGSGSTDHTTEIYESTTVAVAAISGATSITVTDATGILDDDHFAVLLNNGTLFWTTVNGAPIANVVTFDDALTDDVPVDNVVYAYTDNLVRPERVTSARLRNVGNVDVPLITMARQDYFYLPNKSSQGAPTNFYLDKQRTYGDLYVWPTAAYDTIGLLKITFQKPYFIFDSAEDEPDFPEEMFDPLKWNLAMHLAPEYGIKDVSYLKGMADQLLADAEQYDAEEMESVRIEVAP